MTLRLSALRRAYAEELRVMGDVRGSAIVKAFASVPREAFLGRGPWRIHGMHKSYLTPDAAPHWLYHNVLVTINAGKGINNGSPSFWAYLFDHLDIRRGERVLQVGAGTGYYTAILAELVGRRGHVHAVEFEKPLAARARKSLKAWPQVEVTCGDASTFDPGPVDVIVAFCGGTHPAPLWLDRLAPGGRLLMPLVPDTGGGFMLKAVRKGKAFTAEALSVVYVVLASGFRSEREARGLAKALAPLKKAMPALTGLHRGRPAGADRRRAFFIGDDFWLSQRK